MLHSVFFLNTSGLVLIEKHYRGFLNRSVADTFWKLASQHKNLKDVCPVIQSDKFVFCHIQHADLVVLGVIDDEMPALMATETLLRTLDIFRNYFGSVSGDVLQKNFAVVYQLLDELVDNGLPFNTELSLLQEVIPPPSLADVIPLWTRRRNAALPTWGADTSGAQVLWRKRGIKHTANEIYLDVHETVEAILDATGKAVSLEVFGEVAADVSLSDMPDLTLVFKNSRVLNDVGLHNCVRYKRWEAERVVSFVPPEGKFQLMTYRATQGVQLPLYVAPRIHFNRDGGSVSVQVGSKTAVTDKAVECRLTINFGSSLQSTRIDVRANYGKVSVDEAARTVTWDIGKLPKDISPLLEGRVFMAQGAPVPDGNPCLMLEWHCQHWAASGLEVDSLNIANVAYNPFKGVKFLSKSETEIRA